MLSYVPNCGIDAQDGCRHRIQAGVRRVEEGPEQITGYGRLRAELANYGDPFSILANQSRTSLGRKHCLLER